MADNNHGPLLVLPNSSARIARVLCAHCGGSIVLDMRAEAAVRIVEALADAHECPADDAINALLAETAAARMVAEAQRAAL